MRLAFLIAGFNGHPPLGVNATVGAEIFGKIETARFNGHPPLGVNATAQLLLGAVLFLACFNGHPPLGVNATRLLETAEALGSKIVSMGTHPWG